MTETALVLFVVCHVDDLVDALRRQFIIALWSPEDALLECFAASTTFGVNSCSLESTVAECA